MAPKTVQRIVLLLMVGVLAFGLCACVTDRERDARESIEPEA